MRKIQRLILETDQDCSSLYIGNCTLNLEECDRLKSALRDLVRSINKALTECDFTERQMQTYKGTKWCEEEAERAGSRVGDLKPKLEGDRDRCTDARRWLVKQRIKERKAGRRKVYPIPMAESARELDSTETVRRSVESDDAGDNNSLVQSFAEFIRSMVENAKPKTTNTHITGSEHSVGPKDKRSDVVSNSLRPQSIASEEFTPETASAASSEEIWVPTEALNLFQAVVRSIAKSTEESSDPTLFLRKLRSHLSPETKASHESI